jgi:phage FluMu gp28-like protein
MASVPVDNGILLPYQQRWVDDPAPMKIWLASRQIGKSFAIAAEAVRLAREFNTDSLILSSSHRQSREVMRKVALHLRAQRILGGREGRTLAKSKDEATLPNGARIISLPASPDTVRGFSGNIFLDEFAFHQDSRAIWRAMYPTITRGHRVRITSTPNGTLNMFHDIWADETNDFLRFRTSIHDAVAEGFEVDMDRLRRGIGPDPDAWAQERPTSPMNSSTHARTKGHRWSSPPPSPSPL